MLIRVVRYKGRTPDAAAEVQFTEAGGTIGRSSQCTLPLPDPERHISRIQAEIDWSGGRFMLTDRGTANPTMHNGEAVGNGHSVPLNDGDELHCGDYVLHVESRPARRAPPDATPVFTDRSLGGDDEVESGAYPLAGQPLGGFVIPETYQIIGESILMPRPPRPSESPEPPPAGPPRRIDTVNSDDDIDKLFGLSGSVENLSGTDLGQPQPASQVSDTWLPMQDSKPEIRRPIPVPTSLERSPGGSSCVTGQESGDQSVSGRFDSPDIAASTLMEALLAGAGLKEAPRNLLTGKQLELNEDTMRRIGSLLNLFAQGMIDLLGARTTLKSEMHAPLTVIASENNNPLKFSPDASVALSYLLGASTARGFMAPEAAVADAADDLLAHQLGVIAGMRAALAGVLERFRPDQLETRLAARSRLGGIMPLNRKARLWEQFEALYNDVAREAEDNFETLFSNEFARSYEAQIKSLGERRPSKAKR